MRIDGACHCGRIAYAAEIDPERVMICHCTDCQTLSGSAFRTVALTRPGGFTLLAGTPRLYVKVSDSGARREQGFCPDCGTPLFSAPDGDGPKVYSIRVGTARQRREILPRLQIWCRSAQPWLAGLPAIPALETQPVVDR